MQSNIHNRNKVAYMPVAVAPGYSLKMHRAGEDNRVSGADNDDDDEESAIRECGVAFLGSSKVGKTAILEQLVHQQHEERYVPTSTCNKYYKAAYMDGRLYDMTLRDCPGVSCFPQDTVAEWTDYKGYGLHLCQVYVLVYDTGNKDTFNYVKAMRDQILEVKGHEALIVVVGNKYDLTDPRPPSNQRSCCQHNLAKKWKCPFVLCSAKYNYHVVDVFREVLKCIESEIDSKKEPGSRNNSRWRRVDCRIS